MLLKTRRKSTPIIKSHVCGISMSATILKPYYCDLTFVTCVTITHWKLGSTFNMSDLKMHWPAAQAKQRLEIKLKLFQIQDDSRKGCLSLGLFASRSNA